MPTGTAFPIPSTPQEIAASQQAVASFNAQNKEGVDPETATFAAQLKVEQDLLDKHSEFLPDYVRHFNEEGGTMQTLDRIKYPGGIPSNKEVAASNVYARQFVIDALKQKGMYGPNSKATQADKDAMQARLIMESGFLTSDATKGSIGDAAYNKDYSSLPDSGNDQAVRAWMLNNVDYQQNTNGMFSTTPKINPVLNPLPPAPKMGPPAPTSQPVSVNYHIRNTNYGYGADSLGAINQPANNYG